MQWAAQGLALLGIERVRHYAARTQYINLLYAERNYNPPAHQAEYDRMWPCSYRTVQSATTPHGVSSPARPARPTPTRKRRSALHG